MYELNLITQHGRRTASLLQEEAEGILRRSRMTTLHALCSAQDENARLIRANRQLQDENARAVELIRTLADRSEAFRRLVVHLRDAWEPTNPAELSLKKSLAPLLDQKEHELAMDGEWAKQRDAGIAAHLRSGGAGRSGKR